MKTTLLALSLAMAVTGLSACSMNSMNTHDSMGASAMAASDNPMVGGAEMLASRDIIDNAVNSADHTTLVAAVKVAGLVATLKGPGPFTVFAPTNAAFDKLPAGTVDSLLTPEMKGTLTSVLTYHVVPGRLDGAAIAKLIKAGGGKAMLKTVQGETLTARMNGSGIILVDSKGGSANVTTANVYQRNGVIHVIDSVLMP
ncbi:MAG: fasciclin domain-containing protein [Thermomonas sp.]